MPAADCQPPSARHFFGIGFSGVAGLRDAVRLIEDADTSPAHEFRYVVTPNADHILRIVERAPLRAIYNGAWMCLNDSRVLQLLLRLGRDRSPGGPRQRSRGRTAVVAVDRRQARGRDRRRTSASRVGFNPIPDRPRFYHYNPPMGFIESSAAVDAVVDFIGRHLPAVVFLAVGSPNQEIVADACVRRGPARRNCLLRRRGDPDGRWHRKTGASCIPVCGTRVAVTVSPAIRGASPGRYLRDVRIVRIVAREVLWGRSVTQ